MLGVRFYTQHGKLTFFLAVRQITAGKLFRKSTETAFASGRIVHNSTHACRKPCCLYDVI